MISTKQAQYTDSLNIDILFSFFQPVIQKLFYTLSTQMKIIVFYLEINVLSQRYVLTISTMYSFCRNIFPTDLLKHPVKSLCHDGNPLAFCCFGETA